MATSRIQHSTKTIDYKTIKVEKIMALPPPPVFFELPPYGTFKTKIGASVIKAKIEILRRNKFRDEFIKGYLYAQKHTLEEIEKNIR